MQPERKGICWSGPGTIVAVIALISTLLETGALPGQEAAPAYEAKLELLEGLDLEIHRFSGSTGSIDLQDFAAKAQRGLDFMSPGSRMVIQGLVTAAPVAGAVEDRLVEILEVSHEDLAQERNSDWALRLVAEWKSRGARAAQVDWIVLSNGEEQALRSTAVFDPDSRVLYDTVLAGFIEAASEPAQVLDDYSELQGKGGAITSTASATVTGTYQVKVGGLFGGSVDLKVRVGMTSQVAPYIEGSTNDAHVRAATNEIKCWRENGKGIAPDGAPQVYFGSGGRYAAIYGNAVPFNSTIRLSAESDSFQNGTYVVSGNDGRNWELSFSVGVQAGPVGAGIGITPSSDGPCLLSAKGGQVQEITLENRVYYEFIKGYRGVFPDGGSIALRNFALRTGDRSGEIGTCRVSVPVQMAYTTTLGTILQFLTPSIGTLNNNVQYIRGDHLLRPTYALSLSSDTVAPGDRLIATVTVTNPSSAVSVKEGTVSLDLGSLGGKLAILSSSSLPLGEIRAGGSISHEFVLQALEPGRVSVQAHVQGLWESPIPRSVTFEGPASAPRPLVIGGNGPAITSEQRFELLKGTAKLVKKSRLWSLTASGMFLPGKPVHPEDLDGLILTVDGVERFSADQGTTLKAKVNKKTGEVVKATYKDSTKSSLVLDFKKGKLKLKLKAMEGLDPTDEVSLSISFADTNAELAAPGTVVGKKRTKAVLSPASGEFR